MKESCLQGNLRAQRRNLQDQQRAAKQCKAMTVASTEILLLRHGETDWNLRFRLQGQHSEDPPLNATGTEQSRALADRLVSENSLMASLAKQLVRTDPLAPDLACPITAVYSSDLRRAVQTATAAAEALGLNVVLEPMLRERHLGVLEGLTGKEAAAQQPAAWSALRCGRPDARIPGGGESEADLTARAVAGVEAVAARHPGQKVAVFTHGGVLATCYKHAVGHDYPGKLVNCAINRVRVEGQKWAVLDWGDVKHLQITGFQSEAFGGTRTSG
ncbi:probable phosphoglycerate mutase GpmB [Coccomyxa sp. Obi]|nr:probable phosphoglycerate mutase GpmB [Coccomyxa sp. Obi]